MFGSQFAIVASTKRSREIAIGLQLLTEYFDTVVGWEETSFLDGGFNYFFFHPYLEK